MSFSINSKKLPAVIKNNPIVYNKFKGNFIKRCPGTNQPYLCCGYFVLNAALNCPLGCDYCILQAYLDTPELIAYTNWHSIQDELQNFSQKYSDKFFRIGTGELTDSLVLDPVTKFTTFIVPLIATIPNIVLELKTKTNFIQNLEKLEHNRKTVIAWSLSPNKIFSCHEQETSDLIQRLEAARRVIEWGYPVAFHLDPVFNFPGWQDEYEFIIENLFELVDPDEITWISLGAFRFTPRLAKIMGKNPRKRNLILDEFVQCSDGKYRYFWPLRVELLKTIAHLIRRKAPEVFLYLCMESPKIWRKTLGWVPRSRSDLNSRLNDRIFTKFEGLT